MRSIVTLNYSKHLPSHEGTRSSHYKSDRVPFEFANHPLGTFLTYPCLLLQLTRTNEALHVGCEGFLFGFHSMEAPRREDGWKRLDEKA